MKKRIKGISSENILMIVLAFMSLSTGIWSKYRQLWLQDVGYSISGISKILSVALICSSVLAFIISFFSSKIKVKNIVVLSLILRTFSLLVLPFTMNDFIIKTCTLLCIMCEVIFSISYYPLLSFETRSNRAYKKKLLIDYLFKDIGVVACGLLLGVSLGNYVFDYYGCLIISAICSLLSMFFLLFQKSNEENFKKSDSFIISIKEIFKSKVNSVFLSNQLLGYIAYGTIFDLMMLILTNYIGFDVAFTSIFIIVSNMFGTFFSFIFSKISKKYSVSLSAFIKYGTRGIIYLIAFLINKNIMFIFAIIYGFIMSRVLEDKVTGTFVEMIDEKNQFLFGNIRYFIMSLGEGIGAYLAGILLSNSLKVLFLGAGIVTLLHTFVCFYLSHLKNELENS